jgi:hypothetical protein
MFWNTSAHRTVRNLALGGGGGLKTEHLFAGALGIIIVGALVLSIYFGVAGQKEGEVAVLLSYKCDACGEVSTINPTELQTAPQGQGAAEDKVEAGRRPIDCPKCQAKQSAYRMMTCYNTECAKLFVPDSYRSEVGVWGVPDICPHCGSNMQELRKKKILKRRQERG